MAQDTHSALPELTEVISPRGHLVLIPKTLTPEEAMSIPTLTDLSPILGDVRAQLTEALCWMRQLEYEMEVVRAEIKQWSDLQTVLIIREAELKGSIQIIPPPRHTPTDLSTLLNDRRSAAEKESQELKKVNKILGTMKPEELEQFISGLMTLSKTPPKEGVEG